MEFFIYMEAHHDGWYFNTLLIAGLDCTLYNITYRDPAILTNHLVTMARGKKLYIRDRSHEQSLLDLPLAFLSEICCSWYYYYRDSCTLLLLYLSLQYFLYWPNSWVKKNISHKTIFNVKIQTLCDMHKLHSNPDTHCVSCQMMSPCWRPRPC